MKYTDKIVKNVEIIKKIEIKNNWKSNLNNSKL